jgi:putative ABC transport system permease protein
MQPKGGTGFLNQDDQVFVPVTTLIHKLQSQRNARGGERVNQIDVQAADPKNMTQTANEVTDLLLQRHRVAQPDFTVQNPQDIVQQREAAQAVVSLLLGAVAGIALLVGGIGIMNIMLVSVTERTREIGIRKAVGARRRDILMQFLIESVSVSFIGGVAGAALGVGTAAIVNGKTLGSQVLTTSVAPNSILLAFAVAAAIGIFFGLYPASRAASLNPIQALRYE